MDTKQVERIIAENAYVRTGGSDEELACAQYLQQKCAELGFQAQLESFEVSSYQVQRASLHINGRQVPCKGVFNSGCAQVEAPLYYLANKDKWSLEQCRGRIVMVDGGMGYWLYQDVVDRGALGFIVCDGNVTDADDAIDQKELRFEIPPDRQIPGVSIHLRDAAQIVRNGNVTAKIELEQSCAPGVSHNVVLDLPGQTDEVILLCAHYDSTSLSLGAYDNMSSCVVLLNLLEEVAGRTLRRGLRFLWCGSEERGLLGSKAYCRMHEKELDRVVLNINLDMLGSALGRFSVIVAAEEEVVRELKRFAAEYGFGLETKHGLRSSDSNSFADAGVPAISFARYAPSGAVQIHTRTDVPQVVSARQLLQDAQFITAVTQWLADAEPYPFARTIPDKIKEELAVYMCRKRKK